MSERIRPAFVSEVAFSQDGTPRPIHIFRAGTFTSMDGREYTYTPAHIRSMLDNFAAGKRKRPPITEKHDWGRAVGRIAKLWADDACENLYAQPVWNKSGRELLTEETYDGFSSEIEHAGDGRILIGGSLTNYPAVDGLEPVMLEAPQLEPVSLQSTPEATHAVVTSTHGAAITITLPPQTTSGTVSIPSIFDSAPLAAGGLRVDNQTLQEIPRMEENEVVSTPPADVLPPIQAPTFTASDPAVQAQVNAVVQQMTAQFEAQRQVVFEQAQAQFQRQMAEMQARQQIETYAQHATTATLQRQHALPVEASAMTAFLSSLNASQRAVATGLFDRILEAGLVSFEEIGSQGDGPTEQSAGEQFHAAVQAKVASGMSQLSAMQAVGKEQPELYQAYQSESSRRGAVQRKGVK